MPETIVHYMQYGFTACLQNGPPSDWPEGHKWSSNWDDATCQACRDGREVVHTFTIAEDGKSITCLRCNKTSYNSNDVDKHYCGWCGVYHDDIWPPARKAWMKTTPPPKPAFHGMGEYPSLEDMEDCAVCEERKDEPTIPLDKALRDLGLD